MYKIETINDIPVCDAEAREEISQLSEEIVNVGKYDEVSGKYAVEVKTVGKNLLPNTGATQTINGITFTVNEDKSVIANGTATKKSFP